MPSTSYVSNAGAVEKQMTTELKLKSLEIKLKLQASQLLAINLRFVTHQLAQTPLNSLESCVCDSALNSFTGCLVNSVIQSCRPNGETQHLCVLLQSSILLQRIYNPSCANDYQHGILHSSEENSFPYSLNDRHGVIVGLLASS